MRPGAACSFGGQVLDQGIHIGALDLDLAGLQGQHIGSLEPLQSPPDGGGVDGEIIAAVELGIDHAGASFNILL